MRRDDYAAYRDNQAAARVGDEFLNLWNALELEYPGSIRGIWACMSELGTAIEEALPARVARTFAQHAYPTVQ